MSGVIETPPECYVSDNDDRLSYVSAPNSDYSVTTIGSEMARSRQNHDYESEEDEDGTEEPFQYEESDKDYKEDNSQITPDAYLSKAKKLVAPHKLAYTQ